TASLNGSDDFDQSPKRVGKRVPELLTCLCGGFGCQAGRRSKEPVRSEYSLRNEMALSQNTNIFLCFDSIGRFLGRLIRWSPTRRHDRLRAEQPYETESR